MNRPPIDQVFRQRLTALGLSLADQAVTQLETIPGLLTGDPLYKSVSKIGTAEEIFDKHILDSIAPLALDIKWLPTHATATVLDLGTGAGFPVLPLAILWPQLRFTAVDSRQKSVDFVQRMTAGLNLNNLVAVHARAEEIGHQTGFRECFDVVLCRALAEIRVLIEYCHPLLKVGGQMLFYKGPLLEQEKAAASRAMAEFNIQQNDCLTRTIEPPRLPFSRGYLVITKRKPSPSAYPRKNGKPAAQPL